MTKETGAVSLYLIMTVVPLFLFCALFIDYARLRAADKEAEGAVKAGVRSTMSAFSPSVHGYGLFGLEPGGEEAAAIFRDVVRHNLSGQLAESSFRYLDTVQVPGSDRLVEMHTLADHRVLRRQINEEMKFRAPLTYGLEIMDKWIKTGMTDAMKQTAHFSTNAGVIDMLLEERDSKLDKASDEFEQLYNKAMIDSDYYGSALADLDTLSRKIGIHSVEQIRSSLSGAKSDVDRVKSRIKSIDRSIDSLRESAGDVADAIRSLRSKKKELQEELYELNDRVNEWEQLLQAALEYAALLAQLKLKAPHDYNQLTVRLLQVQAALKAAEQANKELNEELGAVKSRSDAGGGTAADDVFAHLFVMSQADFDYLTTGIGAIAALFGGVQTQIEAIVFFTPDQYTAMSERLEQYRSDAESMYRHLSDQQAARNKNKAQIGAAKREQRSKVQAVLDQAAHAFNGCSLLPSADADNGSYLKLQGAPAQPGGGYVQAYMGYNEAHGLEQPIEEMELGSADKAGKSAMKLIEQLSGLLESGRDRLFLYEFALSKFNYRTYGKEKNQDGSPRRSIDLSDPSVHRLASQEAEYILYGSGSCAGNYGYAYGELFALRLAVGTIEALMEPRNEALNLGSPLLVFLVALAEGAVKAQADMFKLLDGQPLPLSSKIGQGLTLYYKDYLRLFMLLHGNEPAALARMQGLIQLNTGQDLREMPTYVQGQSSVSVRLWFMPALMQALGRTGLTECRLEANRCVMAKTAHFSY